MLLLSLLSVQTIKDCVAITDIKVDAVFNGELDSLVELDATGHLVQIQYLITSCQVGFSANCPIAIDNVDLVENRCITALLLFLVTQRFIQDVTDFNSLITIS